MGDLETTRKRFLLSSAFSSGAQKKKRAGRAVFSRGKTWLWSLMLATTALHSHMDWAQAQSAVATVEAQDEGNFARLVINFPDRTLLPPYEASISTSVLRISFPEGIEVNVDDIPEELEAYISVARTDPDGSALRFALRQPVNINSMEAGEKLFVDLLPSTYQGTPPGLPQDVVDELARRADVALQRVQELEAAQDKEAQKAQVELRVGRHPTFSRFVFDWNMPVEAALERKGNLVSLDFNRMADLDLTRVRTDLPPGVLQVTGGDPLETVSVKLLVDSEANVRSFKEGRQFVVDVTPKREVQLDGTVDSVRDQLFEDPEIPARAQDVVEMLGSEESAAADAEAVPAPAAAQVPLPVVPEIVAERVPVVAEPEAIPVAQDVDPYEGDLRPLPVPGTKPELQPVDELTKRRGPQGVPGLKPSAQAEEPADDVSSKTPDADGPAPVITASSSSAPAEEVGTQEDAESVQPVVVRAPAPISMPAPVPLEVSSDADEPEALPLSAPVSAETMVYDENTIEASDVVGVETYRIGDTVRVVFPFEEGVGSAVFRRNEKIWVVFGSTAPLDWRGIPAVLSDMARNVDLSVGESAQALRFDLKRTTLLSVEYQDDAWAVTLGPSIISQTTPVDVERNVQGDTSSVLRLPFGPGGQLHVLDDEEVGDQVYVVTGTAPVRGIIKSHRFPQVNILRSSQGLAVVPNADGVDVELMGEDLVISRPDGLKISYRGLMRGTTLAEDLQDPSQPGLIEFSQINQLGPEGYMENLRAFESAVLNADDEEMRGPRLDLARFYLSNGFAHEAVGMLQMMEAEDALVRKDATYNVMMGAAQMLASRPTEALEYLAVPELSNSPDAAVWRTFAHRAMEDWHGANANLGRAEVVMSNYPVYLQVDFFLAAARTALALGNYGEALTYLSQMDPADFSEDQAVSYNLLRGRIAEASGRSQEALDAYELVVKQQDGPEGAEARFLSAKLRYRDGLISTREALSELEGLAASWRGDRTELRTLQMLAELHAQEGNYRRAFETMAQSVQSDADSEVTSQIQKEMGAVFATLFLEGKAQELEPVKALALFYDFRELVPAGRQGDDMVRMLSSRLIDLDLLDQAASILKHQIDKRLKGAARAQIAADLAVVHLLNRKPEDALRVLAQTRQGQLPAPLQRQRNIVEARALSESGRPDLALELVRNMAGTDVERLRADTLWSARFWRKAGEQLERMNGSRWSDQVPLATRERKDILRAAIAYTLAEDTLSLERLRQKYGEKMSQSPDAEKFEVVTRPVSDRGVEFLAVAKDVGGGDGLDTFLEEYRRQYLSSVPVVPTEEA